MRASSALFLGLCLMTVGLAGCLTPGPAGQLSPGPMAFETIAKGQVSDIVDARTEVVREAAAWAELWAEHTPDEDEGASAVPDVDFSEQMVIAVFHGQAGNTCHGVEIDALTLTDDGPVRVDATTYVPAEDAVCGEALTQPFHIISTQRVDAEVSVSFSEQTRGGQDGGDPTDDPSPTNVTFETLEKGGDSGIEERQERVIRDNTSWQQLWDEHTADRSDPPPAPEVDFAEEMVLAIFKGQSPDGCHRAAIQEVDEADNGSYVVDGAYFKVDAAACTLAIIHPFHMVTVPTDEDPVVFQIRDETSQGGDQSGDGEGADGNVTVETVDRGSQSGIEDRQERVVRDDASWARLWENHTAGQEPQPDRPEVDFSKAIVVAIFKGQSPDGCHGAEITNVTLETQDDGTTELLVEGSYYRVTGDVACSQQITYPFHIVEVEAQPDEVTFEISEDERQA